MLLLLSALALAAPAPLPRPAVQPALIGRHVLVWGSSRYDCLLARDGFYGCRSPHGDSWEGRWSWCAKTRILTVTERIQGQHQERIWKARLDTSLAGYGGYVDPDTGETGEITIKLERFHVKSRPAD